MLLNVFLELGDGLRLAPTILRIAPVWQGLSETCDVYRQLHVTLLRATLFLQDGVWDERRQAFAVRNFEYRDRAAFQLESTALASSPQNPTCTIPEVIPHI